MDYRWIFICVCFVVVVVVVVVVVDNELVHCFIQSFHQSCFLHCCLLTDMLFTLRKSYQSDNDNLH